MSTYNGSSFQDPRNINLKGSNSQNLGIIRWDPRSGTGWATTPIESTAYGLYINSSGQLVFSSLGTDTIIGSSGGGGAVPTWENLFALDKTFNITPDSTWTIAGNRATATDVVTLTNVVGGSGSVLQITNSGTGNDIAGTSATWSVTKAGVATFAGVSISGTSSALATTGAAVWTLLDNTVHSLKIGAAGQTGMLDLDTTNGAEVVNVGAVTFAVAANTTLTGTSNTVPVALLTNNTITTYGVTQAASAGAFVVRSTSLTTGTLIRAQVAEGTLNGGFYFEALDSTGGTSVFTIGKYGATTIAGHGATAILTITAGDVSVTDNTSTATTVLAVAGSGVYTGSTTTSFATITASGLTTGTVLYLPAAALTTGKVVDIAANAATSGTLVNATSTSAAYTSGKLVNVDLTSSSATLATASGALASLSYSLTSTATSGTVSPTNNALKISATAVMNGTGGTLAPSGAAVDVTLVSTQTAGTLTDSRDAVKITMPAGVTGSAINIVDSGTTHAVVKIAGASLTSGNALQVTGPSSALVYFGQGATNAAFLIDASTATSATGLKVTSKAAAAGVALATISSGTNENLTIDAKGSGTITLNGTATGGITLTTAVTASAGISVTGSVSATTTITSTGATSGVGYATGAGGAVTQITSRTTGVTINNVSGAITLVSAAGSATPASLTVTNSAVAATDTVIVNQKSGTDLYEIFVTAVAAGSFKITFFTTGGTTTEQPVFNFAVVKAVAS